MRGIDVLSSRMVNINKRSFNVPSIISPSKSETLKGSYMVRSDKSISGKTNRLVLSNRPKGSKNVLEEYNITVDKPLKLMIHQHQAPGDILMLTATIRDIHKTYPHMFITDVNLPNGGLHGRCAELFENSPYITPLDIDDPEVFIWSANYTTQINRSNSAIGHFIGAFHKNFEEVTGLTLPLSKGYPEVYLSEQEKSWPSRIWEIYNEEKPYWVIDAGRKNDYTLKLWEVQRFQDIVDSFPEMLFVQVGAVGINHYHPPLKGDNVINEVGKTSIRQFCRLMYNAYGCITPVSFPMHLSAAIPMHTRYKVPNRPTIVIAGAREPAQWEAYSTHSYLHNCAVLPCSGAGGCWKSRIEPLNDKDDKKNSSLCVSPVITASGQKIAKCMDMISAKHVIDLMKQYHTNINPFI
jgi:hypothetical protein